MKPGMPVKILPQKELMLVLDGRNFFTEKFRKDAAKKLGGTTGKVDDIDERYARDYFFYAPEWGGPTWSIPVEAVDEAETMKLNKTE